MAERQDTLRAQLAEIDDQRERLRARLAAYGEAPPAPHARTLRDDYVAAHQAIADYTLLIAAARAGEDEETAYQAERGLREVVAMADGILAQMPGACYADLREQGVEVPAPIEQATRSHPAVHVTFAPQPEDAAIAALNIHRSF